MFLKATISNYFSLNWGISSPQLQTGEISGIVHWLEQDKACLLIDKPGIGYWELWAFLHKIPEGLHRKVLIAQHHELRREFQLRGLHFGPEAPYIPDDFRGMLLGTTVHGFEDALRWGEKLNYLFLNLPRDYSRDEIVRFKRHYQGQAVLLDLPKEVVR
jgi:hypothetical protein